ncbi:MAG: hypothetical protein KDJ22_07130 [Candidatus Competibacteraceae bacterium]|jgi:hypothetical protein|nr:hypothetical protein [Candidatus Competibacteraceae bacterium]
MGLLFEKPIDRPIVIYQGGTFRLSDTLYSSDSPSTPLDLTGCSAISEIWESPDSTAPLVRWNTDGADTAITPGAVLTLGDTAGTIIIELSDEATAIIQRLNKPGFWYCALTWPDGDTTWIYAGSVEVATKKERAP